EQAVAALRAPRRQQPLVFEVADLRDRDVRELAAQPPDDLADPEEALALRLLLVARGLRHAMKVIRYFPTCSSSPSSSAARSMRLRFTNVPFSEPWSSTTKWPSSSISNAWLRETVTSSRKMSQSGERPMRVCSPAGRKLSP